MYIKILLSLFILMFSCEKDSELIDITDRCEFPERFLTRCYHGSNGWNIDDLLIRDVESFQQFGNSTRMKRANGDCEEAPLPPIDFSKYSLLSKWTKGAGCSASNKRRVFKGPKNKIIVYEITVAYEGHCEMLIGHRNWAIIPKVEEDYSVEFRVR